MSLVNVGGFNMIPGFIMRGDRAPNDIYYTLDAADELCGVVFQIPRTGTLTKLCVRSRLVTKSDAVKISIQTVDPTTGYPTGTLYQANAYGVIDSVAAQTNYWVALNSGNGISVTKTDIVAVVFEFDSYVAGNLQFSTGISNMPTGYGQFPYSFGYAASTWTLGTSPNMNVGLQYLVDGTAIVEPVMYGLPGVRSTNLSVNSGSNPNVVGMRFKLPYVCRLAGVMVNVDLDDTLDVILYDSDGTTVLESWTLDPDISGTDVGMSIWLQLPTPRIMQIDRVYRLVVAPQTATNTSIQHITVADDGDAKAMAAVDGGAEWYTTSCLGTPTQLSDWTDAPTNRPWFGLIIDQLDDGVSPESSGGRHLRANYLGRG